MKNTKTGQVIKNNCLKTITVSVVTYKNHPLYKKRYVYSKKYLVHDEDNQAKLQDKVMIRQTKPISRRKRWILDKILTEKSTTKKTTTKKEKVKEI